MIGWLVFSYWFYRAYASDSLRQEIVIYLVMFLHYCAIKYAMPKEKYSLLCSIQWYFQGLKCSSDHVVGMNMSGIYLSSSSILPMMAKNEIGRVKVPFPKMKSAKLSSGPVYLTMATTLREQERAPPSTKQSVVSKRELLRPGLAVSNLYTHLTKITHPLSTATTIAPVNCLNCRFTWIIVNCIPWKKKSSQAHSHPLVWTVWSDIRSLEARVEICRR